MTKRSLATALVQVPESSASHFAPIRRKVASRHAPSVYLAAMSESSRHSQRIALDYVAEQLSDGQSDFYTFPWENLRFEHTAAIRAQLADEYAPATAKRMMAALRGAIKAAWSLGQIGTDDYMRAVNLPPIKGESLVAGRALSGAEVRSLFDVCAHDPGITGPRDSALFALLLGAGLRRFEAVALILDDYDPQTGEIRVQKGKGKQGRITYISHSGRECLDYWLDFRGRKPGALLHPTTRSERILRRAINAQTVMDRCTLRAAEAHIRRFTPHDCRRTFISNLLEEGHDLATVQDLVGHASPTTTAKYDRRGEQRKKRAAESILIPFHRPGGHR